MGMLSISEQLPNYGGNLSYQWHLTSDWGGAGTQPR